MMKAPFGKCDECPLKNAILVPSELHQQSKVLFLAEAPGYHEAKEGRPLVGLAGQDFDRIVESCGAKRVNGNYMNAVTCRPTKVVDGKTYNRTPTDVEIRCCNDRLAAEIEAIQPVVIVCMGKIACYDPDTEVLTKDGWKFWDKITKEMELATMSDNGHFKWQRPTELFAYYYQGKMWNVDLTYVNLMVTPNHQVYINKAKLSNGFEFKQADEISNMWRIRMLAQVTYDGDEVSTFTIPGHETISYSGRNYLIRRAYHSKPLVVKMDDWLELLGYYLTEGMAKPTATLVQSKKANFIIWQQMRDCVTRMGLKWSEDKGDGKNLYIRHTGLREYVKQFKYSKDRFVPREFMNLSQRQLHILLDALMAGDGNQTWFKGCKGVFVSYSAQLRSDVQEIAIKCGYGATIFGNNVYIRRKTRGMMPIIRKGDQKWVDYTGMVYCAEVPGHLLLIRRCNKVIWCSNSIALGGDAKVAMKDIVGNKFTWRQKYNVIVTYHPAAIAHSGGVGTERGRMIRDEIEKTVREALSVKHTNKQLRLLDAPIEFGDKLQPIIIQMEMTKKACQNWWHGSDKCGNCRQKFYCFK